MSRRWCHLGVYKWKLLHSPPTRFCDSGFKLRTRRWIGAAWRAKLSVGPSIWNKSLPFFPPGQSFLTDAGRQCWGYLKGKRNLAKPSAVSRPQNSGSRWTTVKCGTTEAKSASSTRKCPRCPSSALLKGPSISNDTSGTCIENKIPLPLAPINAAWLTVAKVRLTVLCTFSAKNMYKNKGNILRDI